MTDRHVRSLLVVLAVAMPAGVAAAQATQPAASQPAEPPLLRVVCLGDSLTGDRPGKSYQGQYLKYTDLLGLMLEARVGVGRVAMHNAGWGGDATFAKPSQSMPGAVGRLRSDVLDLKPDVVTVLISGNDKPATDADRQRTRDNLATIFTRLKAANVKVLALQYPPALPDPANPQKAWTHLSAVNPLIAEAAASAGVPVLDLGPALLAAAAVYPRTDLVNPVDGVHLAPRAELVFARAIFAKLDELGWVARARTMQAK